MIYTTRCFKCGEMAVRLIMGGRSIIHARCQACNATLLDEVLRFEAEVGADAEPEEPDSQTGVLSGAVVAHLDEDTDPQAP